MRPVLVLALLAACSDPDPEPALSDATSLACPAPGALPFRLASHGFVTARSKTIAAEHPRNKDEASDVVGNPGGALATVYLADDQHPAAGAIDYRGAKARTAADSGLTAMALAGENVGLWYYDPDAKAWQALGRTTTDAAGGYDLPATGFTAPNGRPVYAVLEADASCAAHFDFLYPAGTKVVVSDIDGTLTLSDNELLFQVPDASYVPKPMGAAPQLMQAWAAKRYPVIYLTARGNVLRAETRRWLDDLAFPGGALISQTSNAAADVYKAVWLNRMIHDFGWTVVAAYGNAQTDIAAYETAGIAKDRTFIVGPLAGSGGTVAIANSDFTQHIAGFVAAQPTNP